MVCKIIWSPETIETYIVVIEYLRQEWTEREVKNFMLRVDEKLEILSKQPLLGRITGKRRKTHRTLINKQITIVYHYKPIKKEIELVTFWHNSRNPKRFKH
jgi:plasmid stabilization system protein ParE